MTKTTAKMLATNLAIIYFSTIMFGVPVRVAQISIRNGNLTQINALSLFVCVFLIGIIFFEAVSINDLSKIVNKGLACRLAILISLIAFISGGLTVCLLI